MFLCEYYGNISISKSFLLFGNVDGTKPLHFMEVRPFQRLK